MPIGLRIGDAAVFWAAWDTSGAVLTERQRWLAQSPGLFAGCLPDGEAGMREALSWMQTRAPEPEPDWVLLSPGMGAEPVALAGEVVFPSGWSLPEKLGLPLSMIHAPVPGLQASIGAGIGTFLDRIECGAEWERENWGMCPSEELNRHPSRHLPGLPADSRLEGTWIRLESQFLTRLPQTRCLLFGIRVNHFRLDVIAALPGMAVRIRRALHTMPEPMAHYKGLADGRESLIHLLKARGGE